MRQIVRDGHALGLFVEGTRQLSGVPGPGPARRGDGRDPGGRAGRPGRDPRLADLEARQLPPGLDRVGRADPLRRASRRAARATRRRRSRSRREIRELCATGSSRCTSSGARDGDAAAHERRPTISRGGRGAARDRRHRRDRRLPERRQVDAGQPADPSRGGGRPRDAGRHARPQGAPLRVDGHVVPAHRHGRRRRGRRRAVRRRRSRSRRGPAVEEADLVLFVVDARAGITPGDEELAEILAGREAAGDRAREQDRRPAPRPRGARVPPARPRRSDARSRRCTATAPATCSTRSSRGSRATGEVAGRRGGDPRRDPRPAERRQVVAPERARRRGSA